MNIDCSGFDLKHAYFDQQSKLHGQKHTYRVMVNVLAIGNKLVNERKVFLAFCAAFIHDMARKHDGLCQEHGKWAVQNKLPMFRIFFEEKGLSPDEIDEIATAVEYHSYTKKLDRTHPHYLTTAILKDADALDRIRLGENGLDVKYLRFKQSLKLVNFSEQLYFKTEQQPIADFHQVVQIAQSINQHFFNP